LTVSEITLEEKEAAALLEGLELEKTRKAASSHSKVDKQKSSRSFYGRRRCGQVQTEAPSPQFVEFDLQQHKVRPRKSQVTISDTFEELGQSTSKTTSPFPYSM
jgi:glycine cleavage system aminomethyltransferase T